MLRIFNASAGSGKTYVLVKNYILLVIKNYNNIKTILTITFTNQATQQIKDRIILALHSLATDHTSPLFKDIQSTLFWKTKKIQKHAKNVLHFMLNNYDFFNISTIDSFLQSIIRSFNYELGIQYGYKVDLENGNAINFIIDDLLKKMTKDPNLSQWISNFIKNNFQNEKTINIKTAIKQTISNIFTEQFLKYEKKIPSNFEQLKKNITTIQEEIKNFERTMTGLAEKILQTVQQNNLSINDFSYKEKGIIGFPLKIVTQKNFTPSDRILKFYATPELWFNKKENPNMEIVLNQLAKEYLELMDFYFENFKDYNTNKIISKTFYFYGIINELLDSLAKYRTENNTMLISDISNFLKQITEDNEVEFIFEKVGTYYNHFFIDEFQDISEYQWINIKTLVENSLAQGYNNMIVGDVKQSIYRWRGGNSKLLGYKLQEEFGKNVTVDELTKNFRSSRNIVEHNNIFFLQEKNKLYERLFTQVASIEDDEIKNSLLKFLRKTNKMYDHIEQNCQSKIFGEVVTLQIQEEEILEKIFEVISSLQSEKNNFRNITILVRTNLEGEKIMNFLVDQGVRTLSNSALKLSKNIAIKLLVNCIFYFFNFDRRDIILFEIASFYKSYHNKEENILSFVDEVKKKIFSINKPNLYQLTMAILEKFEIEKEEAVYTFLDVINEYTKDDDMPFDKWWEVNNERFKVVLEDDIDAVKIMTIHQSKGLEFKNVIIPFELSLDDNISKNDLQWFESEFGFLPTYYSKNLKDSKFFHQYYKEFITRYYDNLNVMYVALTRAKEKMFLFSKKNNDEN
ncbi:MAG: UvrD-helicase domain-containing protein [Cytophagales bacterium]|jgi:ATP-dependent exoDNAse (exonuclease V) beta subunit|nr:UvrD-helicase domain-containing protein [Cytophagales bacterium]